jgi:hypothetical protein
MAALLMCMALVSWKEIFTQVYLAFKPWVEKKQSPMFPKKDGVEVAHHQSWCRVSMFKVSRSGCESAFLL